MPELNKTKWGDKTNRRLNILLAARQQLAEVGYQGFNMRDLAMNAGVSSGLVYSYFANKEELFATLYAERLVEFQQEMLIVYTQVTTIDEMFLALLKKYLPIYQCFGRDFNLFSLLRQKNDFSPEFKEQLSKNAIALMSSLFNQAQQLLGKQGVTFASIPQAELILPMFWIVLNGLADHFSGDRQHLYGHNMETMTHFISTTMLSGLQHISSLQSSTHSDEA